MTGERCDRTELLVTDCAHCRGNDQTIQEQAEAERLKLRAWLLSTQASAGWFTAQFGGKCWGCREYFGAGSAIRRTRSDELLHGTEPGYVGECCAVTS